MTEGLIIDCFAGGGGASTGIEQALNRPVDIAVNHDPKAIAMHRANHPDTYHVTEDIFSADLKGIVGGRSVSLMWASPDCTSHSRAKGGTPRKSGLRMLPWAVHKHASDLLPNVIIMENVPEIQKWGPIGDDGLPVKEREGETYAAFVAAMKHLGYAFESRELAACDYGAPTTRRRWYAILRRDGKPAVWPSPSHGDGLFGDMYKTAAECIDWSDLGTSIFGRKRPLAEATNRRIARGIVKYVLSDDPKPFIVPIGYGERTGQLPRVNSIEEPLGTIVAQGTKHYLCTAWLSKYYGGVVGQSVDDPLHTITACGGAHFGLVACHLSKFYGTSIGQHPCDPMAAITAGGNHIGLVAAFLTKYYGSGTGQRADEPVGTVTTKDRFGLVTVKIDGASYALSDILLRMLKPKELLVAQGFPNQYVIDQYDDGKPVAATQQVKMIGNSVSPPVARALVEANCVDARMMEVA
ncbi:DNA cytosine methyltransferase [Gordonibacter sp.]|uniref:DNA cytosine methyltransferase n=1 Tax=Gordonibacter sp. TaxID=1968902 RepID=UPI002FC87C21